jgi:O-glycosyl hydrolase
MPNLLWLLLKRIRPDKKSIKRRATEMRRHRFEQLEPRTLLSAATVNWNDVRQTIDGFGASSAWASGTISSTALAYLYSPVTGAGLSLLRSRVAPNVGTSENLIMEQVAAYGARVWSTPWTPPREWKTNHDNANGGSLDPAHYQDYANALADYAQDMTRQGIPLYALSIQNEPNWTATYESCRWTAQQFADFLPYLGQTFAARGITTKIMLPEQLNWDFSLASTIMANPALAQYVGILAAHNYGETSTSWKPCTIADGRPVWETEIYSTITGTELDTAIDTADDIHQAMTDGNANAYHYWWLSASDAGGLTNNWTPTKRLWAMGQYSRFVRPGWVRIGETDDGGLDITTFKDPVSGKFALVVVNTSATNAVNESFTLSGVTAANVTPYVTSSTQDMAQGTAITLAGGTSFSATIAARTIETFYGVSSTAASLQAPTNAMAAPVQGSMYSQIGLSWSDNSSSETAYTVERSTDGANWTVLTSSLAANSISYTDTGRAENTLYYYRVKPTNGDATTYSAIVSTSTILRTPSNVNGTRVSNGINLTWTINSTVSTGVAVDRSLDGLTWANIANLATRTTSYFDVISGYNAGQIYYYRVRNTFAGNYSALAAWNTGQATPTNFAVAGVTTSSVTLTWTGPLGASGAWIQQYNSGSWSTVSPSSLLATSGTYTVTGLSASTTYSFRMRASSDADAVYSSYTSSVNATTTTPSVNPVVWYKADESTGSTLADSSGNGKTATLTGSYGFTTGFNGNAVNFTGGYASLPTGIVGALGDFTIAAWIKPTTIDSWARVFDFGAGTSNYMFFTPKASDTSLPRFAITTGSGEQQINSSAAISSGTWTHVAITLSGNTATLYINGVVAGANTSMTLRPSSLGSTTQNYIGKSQFSADPTFKGAVDDFRIYERSLSASEVGTLANIPPTVATAAAASPSTVTGTTTALSVLGADNGGESNLNYTWATIGTPPAAVTFSANGANAAKNTTANFTKAGTYNFQVTIMDSGGLSVTSSVSVTVIQTLTAISVSPSAASLTAGNTQQFTATAYDQFGNALSTQPTFNWSAINGDITSAGLYTAPATGTSATVTASSDGKSGTAAVSLLATVAGQMIFYNNSKFDADTGNLFGDPAANLYDDNAIATDKQALLPGHSASFANYTSYSRGINGVMIDIQNLAGAPTIDNSAQFFTFKVGSDGTNWSSAPAPAAIDVRTGAGTNVSYRVTITWADNAIQNEWLQVTVLAGAGTGLAAPHVFYFGNLIGESGDNAAEAVVNLDDEIASRTHKTGFSSAAIVNLYDYNRDGKVNAADDLIARHNVLNTLELITPSAAPLAAMDTLNPVILTQEDTPALTPAASAAYAADVPSVELSAKISITTSPSPVKNVLKKHLDLFLSDSLQIPAKPITPETPRHDPVSRSTDFQGLRKKSNQSLIGKSNSPDSTQYLLHDAAFLDQSNWAPIARHRLPRNKIVSKGIDVNIEDCMSDDYEPDL